MEKIEILIVDDHKMVREGIKSVIENTPDICITGEASNGIEALKILDHNHFDILLTDISMPKMDGVELMKEIVKKFPNQKVIALTMMGEGQHIKQMLKAGAKGYLLKNCGSKELINAIKKVHDGENYYTHEVTQIVMDQLSAKRTRKMSVEIPLTERELEVLHLVLKEYSNKEIAEELFISPRTVDAHKRNLIEKTGSKNIAGLVLYAIEKRLFDDI
jgi:DNA-binding NarL/FixJ family response regulator